MHTSSEKTYLVQTTNSQLCEVPVPANNGLCGSFSEGKNQKPLCPDLFDASPKKLYHPASLILPVNKLTIELNIH